MSGKFIRRNPYQDVLERYLTPGTIIGPTLNSINDSNIFLRRILDGKTIFTSNKFSISLSNIFLTTPRMDGISADNSAPMYPVNALNSGETYKGNVLVDVDFQFGKKKFSAKNVYLTYIPVATRSELCNLHGMTDSQIISSGDDPKTIGGIYIIEGQEKAIMTSLKIEKNLISTCVTANFFYSNSNEKRILSVSYSGSMPDGIIVRFYLFQENVDETSRLKIQIPKIGWKNFDNKRATDPISLTIFEILFLLDGTSQDENIEKICSRYSDETMREKVSLYLHSLENTEEEFNLEILEDQIAKFTGDTHSDLINRYRAVIFGNMSTGDIETDESILRRKAEVVRIMAMRYINVSLGFREPEDMDSLINQRLDLPGTLLEFLYNRVVGHFIRQLFSPREKNTVNVAIQNILEIGEKKFSADDGNIKLICDAITRLGVKYIGDDISKAIKTGTWGVTKIGSRQAGTTQQLNRQSIHTPIAQIRRIITQKETKGKSELSMKQRDLSISRTFYLCPVSTSEDDKVGYNNALAICMISRSRDSYLIFKIIENYGISVNESTNERRIPVFLNLNLIGWCDDGMRKHLIRKRRNGTIPEDVRIYLNRDNELIVKTESGALVAPYLIVENGKIVLDSVRDKITCWNDYLVYGCVEFLDYNECTTSGNLIALGPEYIGVGNNNYTHCIIDGCLMFSFETNLIKFANHAQGPRDVYQSHMGKQMMNIAYMNWYNRMNDSNKILFYPQRSLITTALKLAMGYDSYDPMDSSCTPLALIGIVAIMCSDIAMNSIEDNAITNRRFIETGAGRNVVYHNYEAHIKFPKTEFFGLEDEFVRKHEYRHIDPQTGCPELGAILEDDDVVIGMFKKVSEKRELDYGKSEKAEFITDASVYVKPTDRGDGNRTWVGKPITEDDNNIYKSVFHGTKDVKRLVSAEEVFVTVVDKISIDYTAIVDGDTVSFVGKDSIPDDQKDTANIRTIRVRTRVVRRPQPGDKCVVEIAQKSTFAKFAEYSEMPFEEATGMTPDLILNPHSIPTRMPVGLIHETVLGIACAENGVIEDGTVFRQIDTDALRSNLISLQKRKNAKIRDAKLRDAEISKIMDSHGYSSHGVSTFRSGITGESFQAQVFYGPVGLSFLKHQVEEKIQECATAKLESTSRQPVKGRGRGGGIRFGELERDCLITHGAAQTAYEQLCGKSDRFLIRICKICGRLSDVEACYHCSTKHGIMDSGVLVESRYSLNMLYNYCYGLKVGMKFTIEEK